jgi:hypothetical protein
MFLLAVEQARRERAYRPFGDFGRPHHRNPPLIHRGHHSRRRQPRH